MSSDGEQALRRENERLRARIAELQQEPHVEAAAFLRSVLAAVPAFIMRTDAELKIRYINQLAPPLTMPDVLGKSPYDFIDPKYHKSARECIDRARATGEPQQYETMAVGPHGAPAYYQTSIAPITGADGRRGVCFVAIDVTERKGQQERLRESEEKLRVALTATGVGIWSSDFTTGEVVWDDRMRKLCGREEPAGLEDYITEMVHPDDRAAVAEAGRLTMETGEFVSRPHRIVRGDGKIRWMLTTGSVFTNAEGKPAKLVGGNIDITEQRALEDQLLHAQKMEAVGNLTAGVAHNFNNMLMVMLPSLDLLRNIVPPSHKSLVGDATESAERAAAMVRQLMTFAGQRRSGFVAGQQVSELVSTAVRMCRNTFDRHIQLLVNVGADVPNISCDPSGIEQVLMNVLLNARDAVMDAGHSAPKITVSVDHVAVDTPPVPGLESAQRCVVIVVSDDGIGMDETVRQKIFEPFFTTKGIAKGTGLGLATSYAIVRDHNGWIESDSTAGVGTHIRIHLPTTGETVSKKTGTRRKQNRAQASRILIVDDEAAVLRTAAGVLESQDHDVLCASSAQEALTLVRETKDIALVLLDRSMPGAPGQTLVPVLRRELPHAKILYFTGHEVSAEDLTLVDGVIAKPVNMRELLRRVADALGS